MKSASRKIWMIGVGAALFFSLKFVSVSSAETVSGSNADEKSKDPVRQQIEQFPGNREAIERRREATGARVEKAQERREERREKRRDRREDRREHRQERRDRREDKRDAGRHGAASGKGGTEVGHKS